MHEVTELLPHCPWAHWQRPNIKWCEENICAVITTPANTWSNLVYILVGGYIFYEGARNYERQRRKKAWTIRTMGIAAIICGLCSFSYHASYTKFFQFFDYLGMYVYIAVPITLNFRRLQIFTKHQQYWVAFIAIVVEMIITYIADVFKIKIQFIMALNILLALSLELSLWCCFNHEGNVNRRPFVLAILFLAIGTICSFLDLTGRWCNPKDHVIQGHAFWHVFTSISFYYIHSFFSQFDWEDDKGRGVPLLVKIV